MAAFKFERKLCLNDVFVPLETREMEFSDIHGITGGSLATTGNLDDLGFFLGGCCYDSWTRLTCEFVDHAEITTSTAEPATTTVVPATATTPFTPPWNDDPSTLTDWSRWCAHELNEGCYACENPEGAARFCPAECGGAGCPGFA